MSFFKPNLRFVQVTSAEKATRNILFFHMETPSLMDQFESYTWEWEDAGQNGNFVLQVICHPAQTEHLQGLNGNWQVSGSLEIDSTLPSQDDYQIEVNFYRVGENGPIGKGTIHSSQIETSIKRPGCSARQ